MVFPLKIILYVATVFSFWLIRIDPFYFPCKIVLNCPGLEIGNFWYLRTMVFTNFSYVSNLYDGFLEDCASPYEDWVF